MNRISQIILIMLSLMYLAPAQAMINIDSDIGACQVFAEDDKEAGEKKDGTNEGEEEEEPDCD